MVKVQLKDINEVRLMIARSGNNLSSFSEYIGISQPYLSQIIKGDKYPSPTTAKKIAKGLGVNMEDIFLIQPIDKSMERKGVS